MRRSRYSVEQIVAVLKQVELGMLVADACRKLGISEQTFYRWKKQYGSLEPDQARELKQLQEENALLDEAGYPRKAGGVRFSLPRDFNPISAEGTRLPTR